MLAEEEASAELYEVEKVCDVRQQNKGFQVLIKWSGYDDPEDNTWEPYTNLNEETCLYFLREFRQTLAASASSKSQELKMQVLEKIIRLWKARMRRTGKQFNDSGELSRLLSEKEDEDDSPKPQPVRPLLEEVLDDSDFRIKKKSRPLDLQTAQAPADCIPDASLNGEYHFGGDHFSHHKKRPKPRQPVPSSPLLEQSLASTGHPSFDKLSSSPLHERRLSTAAGKPSLSCNRHLLKLAEALESAAFCQSIDAIAGELRIDSCEQLAKNTRSHDCLYVSADASSTTADLRSQVFSAGQYLLMHPQDAIGRQVQAIGEKLRFLSEFHRLCSRLI